MLLDRIERVRYGVRRRGMADLHRDRIMLDFAHQFPDVIGHRGREQQCLAFGRHLLDDPPDIGQETHVEHAVRLVQHEHFHMRQVDRFLVEVVEQTAGAGHDDLDAGAQFLDLGVHAHAAVNGGAAQFRVAAERDDGHVGLFGQLPRRSDDQGADTAARSLQQALQDRQHKSGRLPGPGLRQAHDIASLQDRRYRLVLNGGWGGIAERLDTSRDAWMELECFEFHCSSL